eukprot:804268-Pleurochrysis_carterae.AAC.1
MQPHAHVRHVAQARMPQLPSEARRPGPLGRMHVRRLRAHMVVAERLAPGASRSGACARAGCKRL